jgi:transcriptional regulator with XRE-family HTH domain
MRKNSIRERAKRVSPEIKSMVSRSMAVASLITDILERKRLNQKYLAEKLGKKESEISKWLKGTHNFTFKTIGKIEAVLGESLIYTADEAIQEIYLPIIQHDEGEQSNLNFPNTNKFKYTDVKRGKTFEIEIVSVSITQDSISKLDECQAN